MNFKSRKIEEVTENDILTNARLSVWDAINNCSDFLKSDKTYRITKRYSIDDNGAGIHEIRPAIRDLPAIAVLPATVTPSWVLNRQQEWPYSIDIHCWTPHWNYEIAEGMTTRILNAIGQVGPEQSIPDFTFIKRATGYYPRRFGPVNFATVRLGDQQDSPKSIRTTIKVTLRLRHDPLGRT